MEIFVLIMLYYLSQNPDFLSRVKPIMGEMKNSQEVLKFITDLSKFASIFNQNGERPHPESAKKEGPKQEESKKQSSSSQTNGIADDFIQQCLENYFKKR